LPRPGRRGPVEPDAGGHRGEAIAPRAPRFESECRPC
jgi:hypothetical protein